MSAYFIASYRITDPKGYEPYPAAATATLLAHSFEPIVAD